MGLSSLPTPSESVLTLLLVNTAFTISIFKEIFRSALHVFGLSPEREVSAEDETTEIPDISSTAETSLKERFRSRIKPIRFGSAFGGRRLADRHADCRVCLARFEPESEVNRLSCGHLFHKSCVERWIEYQNATCPLCRSHLFPPDDLGRDDSVFTVYATGPRSHV